MASKSASHRKEGTAGGSQDVRTVTGNLAQSMGPSPIAPHIPSVNENKTAKNAHEQGTEDQAMNTPVPSSPEKGTADQAMNISVPLSPQPRVQTPGQTARHGSGSRRFLIGQGPQAQPDLKYICVFTGTADCSTIGKSSRNERQKTTGPRPN